MTTITILGINVNPCGSFYRNDMAMFYVVMLRSFLCFQKYLKPLQNKREHQIKVQRSVRGGEYNYNEFEKLRTFMKILAWKGK